MYNQIMIVRALVVFILISFQGCVSQTRKPERGPNVSNYIVNLSLGVYVVQDEKRGLVVERIPADMPLSSVLRTGDVLVSVNKQKVATRTELINETNKYGERDTVVLDVKRGDRTFQVKTKLKRSLVRRDLHAVFRLLAAGKNIHLTIIVDRASNSFIKDGNELKEWKKTIKSELLTSLENDFLSAFGSDRLFELIDREKVNDVLGELRFGMTGFVSTEETVKIGEFLGATHILFAQYSRLQSAEKPYRDVKNLRLIEVATDRVLASLSISKE